jgi:hypothetical protein
VGLVSEGKYVAAVLAVAVLVVWAALQLGWL